MRRLEPLLHPTPLTALLGLDLDAPDAPPAAQPEDLDDWTDEALRRAAPELLDARCGLAEAPADEAPAESYALATLALEALSGELPQPGEALAALLPDRAVPRDLSQLLELARAPHPPDRPAPGVLRARLRELSEQGADWPTRPRADVNLPASFRAALACAALDGLVGVVLIAPVALWLGRWELLTVAALVAASLGVALPRSLGTTLLKLQWRAGGLEHALAEADGEAA